MAVEHKLSRFLRRALTTVRRQGAS
jgi:hypothetical protein